jgi:hypothetical protein
MEIVRYYLSLDINYYFYIKIGIPSFGIFYFSQRITHSYHKINTLLTSYYLNIAHIKKAHNPHLSIFYTTYLNYKLFFKKFLSFYRTIIFSTSFCWSFYFFICLLVFVNGVKIVVFANTISVRRRHAT